jgi:protein SCO1/2
MTNVAEKKSHTKTILMIVLFMMFFAGLVLYSCVIQPKLHAVNAKDIKIDGVFLSESKEIEDFQLTDGSGKPFTKENLKGRWTLMFFGFTNCGYVCPTTLAALNDTYKTLQAQIPDNKLPQVVMVSVDPERDSMEKMQTYVHAFNQHFIGTRADEAATVALEKQLHIAAVKMQVDGQPKDQYSINHSAEIMLFNPDGKLQAYFSYPHTAEQMVRDYKLILSVGPT